MQSDSQFSLWSLLKIVSTRINYSLHFSSNTRSFSDWPPCIAALEEIFLRTLCCFKIFSIEKRFCFCDYPKLRCYILCVFRDIIEKLICKMVVQHHFGHVVCFRTLWQRLGGRQSLLVCGSFPALKKEQKLSGRKMFTPRVDSSYIK